MEIVSMIDVEDAAAIQSQVKECIEKDPGAVESETMVIKLEGDTENEGFINRKSVGNFKKHYLKPSIQVVLEKNT
jgi:tetrahydromethanopterin S-methyltransferase subunit A